MRAIGPGLVAPLKLAAKRVFGRLGYVVLRSDHVASLPLAKHLDRIFARYRIDCVFDVGANTGQYGSMLRDHVGYKGPIVSVEPVREFAERLRARAAGDKDWLIRTAALGAKPGTMEINVARAGDFTSFLRPNLNSGSLYAEELETLRREQVEVTTVEALLAWTREQGIEARNIFMKLDTQGYDLEVLKGAAAALHAIRAVQTELAVQPIYQGMPSFRTALDSLEALGFHPSGLFPVTLDERLQAIEMDCVLVRRAEAERAAAA